MYFLILILIILNIIYITSGLISVIAFLFAFINVIISHLLLIANHDSIVLALIKFINLIIMVIIISQTLNQAIILIKNNLFTWYHSI
jgi:hypothetical protein